ncbi:OmpA family protein [Pseudoalteromonas xiamenensis]|uniref:OmpA family protein n=1 Tax=Pseudoalteromonas xiamenensis TaxID=882626 RepID=A0A975HM49_9GAMM|nr:OmpA family protein [Pseudoalteromonas xiamenensis]QTH70690.1 OmpA family protein [Pseudoalteromonas xiamenensis]
MKLKALSIALLVAAGAAHAQDDEGVFLGVFGDYYKSEWQNIRDAASVNVDKSTSWGVELGYKFDKYWAARLEYADMDFDLSGARTDSLSGSRFGIDGLYHINGGPLYGIFGIKSIDAFESMTFANLGAGYQLLNKDNWSVNLEALAYQGIDRGYSDYNAKLGVSYLFGSSSSAEKVEAAPAPAAPVAAPADADQDGVMDADDQCANTPMTDAVDSKGCTLYRDEQVSVNLLVRFPHDASKVTEQYFSDIKAVAEFMAEHSDATVVLEGHASAVGAAQYNQWLSKKRADAVAKQLVKLGVAESRISTVGYGEERLKNTANTRAAHAENRRVEAQVTSTEKVKVQRK